MQSDRCVIPARGKSEASAVAGPQRTGIPVEMNDCCLAAPDRLVAQQLPRIDVACF